MPSQHFIHLHLHLLLATFLLAMLHIYPTTASRADEKCPPNHLSCATISEPSFCCPVDYTCGYDDAGAVACCKFRTECRGVAAPGNTTTAHSPTASSDGRNQSVGQIAEGSEGGVVASGGGNGVGGFVQSTGDGGGGIVGLVRGARWALGVVICGVGWVNWG